jgi:hypothetical protein
MPTRIITGVPQDRVEQIKRIQLAGGAVSVDVEPDDEGGFFRLIVTWPEGTVLTEDE